VYAGKYNEDDEQESTEVVKITKGYSKDNNPELNQVVLSLMCSYRSSIPVWLEVLIGNNSDKKALQKASRNTVNSLKEKVLFTHKKVYHNFLK
jgi:transposase